MCSENVHPRGRAKSFSSVKHLHCRGERETEREAERGEKWGVRGEGGCRVREKYSKESVKENDKVPHDISPCHCGVYILILQYFALI